MLKMSRKTDYALQFLVALAKTPPGDVLSVKTFAEKSNISFLFLQRIARSLRSANIIVATKGKYGGYTLTTEPSKLSIQDVVDAVEGDSYIAQCMKTNDCEKQGLCDLEAGVKKIQKDVTQYLQKTTVADIS